MGRKGASQTQAGVAAVLHSMARNPHLGGERDNRFAAYREEERGIGAVPALAGPIGVGRPVRHSSLPDVASLTWGRPRGNHPGRGNGPVRVN